MPGTHVLTVIQFQFTAVQVPADAGRVVPSSQRVLQALDQVTEVVESLKDLCTLVQHGQVHHWLTLKDVERISVDWVGFEGRFLDNLSSNLCPEWGVCVHEQKSIFFLHKDYIFFLNRASIFY